MTILSVYQTLRSCAVCGQEFLPTKPKHSKLIPICCSPECVQRLNQRRMNGIAKRRTTS